MITRIKADLQVPDWRRSLAEAVTDPQLLLQMLDLPAGLLPAARAAADRFGLRVPRGFVALMKKGDPDDPLLRQVLPLAAELKETPGFGDDPVGDLRACRGAGLLQKYRGRALLLASPACAVHCRYCFRRAFPYAGNLAGPGARGEILTRLRREPDTTEIILSGGDPLTLDDHHLAGLVRDLETVPRLRRLRIHTRLPVVIPERVTEGLCSLLAGSRLQPIVVLHFNHPNELAPATVEALGRLRGICTLLNQSVLLRGVNDSLPALVRLSERLFDSGVLPYYIHLLDRVRGAAHFEVQEPEAVLLMRDLRRQLPGYLVPRLVREEPGEPTKTPVV